MADKTINSKIILFFSILGLVLLILISDLWLISQNNRFLADMHFRRYQSRQLAEELRRSSDELTRMARTYVETGEIKYLNFYHLIIAIREGKAPRPQNYENIYWDFMCGTKDYYSEPGMKISLENSMKVLHFTELEMSILFEAKKRSDTLTSMESRAFAIFQGITDESMPDPELARKLLFSDEYHYQKASIMKKIDEFFNLLDNRTKQDVERAALLRNRYLLIALVLSFTLSGLCLIGFLYFRNVIVEPLKNLTRWITAMQDGTYDFDDSHYRNDEIGMVANAFSVMATQVSESISNLKYLSRTDSLTKISNRIALDEALLHEINRFERYEIPCAVIMLDIDHFKRINDKFSHSVGDKILIEISNLLTQMVRKTDALGRWGGEEFLIIAPNLSLQQGRQFAEIIRGGISSHTFSEIGNVTVSLGVTELKKDISMEDVFKTVDELLYQAKAEGRNRVC